MVQAATISMTVAADAGVAMLHITHCVLLATDGFCTRRFGKLVCSARASDVRMRLRYVRRGAHGRTVTSEACKHTGAQLELCGRECRVAVVAVAIAALG